MLDFLSKIGPFIGGISLAVAAAIGVYTSFFIRKRENISNITDAFRVLYEEFWNNPDTTEIRRRIINRREYAPLDRILENRMRVDLNELSPDENNIIERLDKFCSVLVRIRSYDHEFMSIRQRKLWNKILNGDFWIREMQKRNELKKYLEKHWPELLD